MDDGTSLAVLRCCLARTEPFKTQDVCSILTRDDQRSGRRGLRSLHLGCVFLEFYRAAMVDQQQSHHRLTFLIDSSSPATDAHHLLRSNTPDEGRSPLFEDENLHIKPCCFTARPSCDKPHWMWKWPAKLCSTASPAQRYSRLAP